MIQSLIKALITLLVLGLVYYLGTLLLAAIPHAPAFLGTIWLVLVILMAILVLVRMFGLGDGPSPRNRLW